MHQTERDRCIESNRSEFGDGYDALKWIGSNEAVQAQEVRKRLLDDPAGRMRFAANGSKPHLGELAPGCKTCLEGTWSCLFVSGRCNCRCFYCPARQDADDVPMTNTVPFPRVDEYLEYLERFGYRGVGISGGEPLLTFETSLQIVAAVKKRFGNQAHVWLYTNGTLADEANLGALRDAGLDEMRFDIGATGYQMDKALLAVGRIPTVTVEIPAVPEERERLKQLLPRMRDGGIAHLNLHQLRLTPHNFSHLSARGYTFVHGERVTVLESELTALEILKHSADAVGMPVNYCSFVYRDRYQQSAARRRSGGLVQRGHETFTESAHLRGLSVEGGPDIISGIDRHLLEKGIAREMWRIESGGRELFFHPELWDTVVKGDPTLKVAYVAGKILPALTYRHPFSSVTFGTGRSIYVERRKGSSQIRLKGPDIQRFRDMYLKGIQAGMDDGSGLWGEIASFEKIPAGLAEYF